MGYPTKVQLIHRAKGAEQWYINLPTAIAEAMDFKKGELVYWHVEDKANLVLHRPDVPPSRSSLKEIGSLPNSGGREAVDILDTMFALRKPTPQ